MDAEVNTTDEFINHSCSSHYFAIIRRTKRHSHVFTILARIKERSQPSAGKQSQTVRRRQISATSVGYKLCYTAKRSHSPINPFSSFRQSLDCFFIFTRESSYCFQRLLAIAVLSVRLSVRHTDGSVKDGAR